MTNNFQSGKNNLLLDFKEKRIIAISISPQKKLSISLNTKIYSNNDTNSLYPELELSLKKGKLKKQFFSKKIALNKEFILFLNENTSEIQFRCKNPNFKGKVMLTLDI